VPTLRLWVLISVALAALTAEHVARAQTTEARTPIAATEADQLADFLVLAIKPEGEKNYQLIEIGDTKIDADRLRAAVPAPTGNLLAKLGIGGRDYDEAGEVAACRSACKANTRCRDFAYAPPSDGHPLGVCRLKAIVQSPSFGVMAPVAEDGDPEKRQSGEAAPATITFDDKDAKGTARYNGADARPTPVTLKFAAPIANARILIGAAATTGQRTWANVEALDANGKLIERTGAWIAPDREPGKGQAIALAGGSDRIASIKIDAREPGALLLEGIEFARAQTIPPSVVENAVEEPTVAPPREEIPPPPALPPLVAERFPLPPRAIATEAPADITAPPVDVAAPPVAAEPPPLAANEPAEVAIPIAPLPEPPVAATEPAPQPRQRGLPLWLALGAVGVMFAGAGVYWRNHRARTLTRLTTRLVSAGFEQAKITVEHVEGADVNLRFVVRAPANTNFELARKGVPA
jgi:hypothetical protein